MSQHRWPDGSPRSELARADDASLQATLSILQRIRRENPSVLITIEQPLNRVFLKIPVVAALVEQTGWFILEGTHCSAASSSMDLAWQVNPEFSCKPSMYVVWGLDPEALPTLGICANDCSMRLATAPNRHRNLICRRCDMLPGQNVITDVTVKGRIPYYTTHQLWMSNCRLRGLCDAQERRYVCAQLSSKRATGERMLRQLHSRLCHPGEKALRATLSEIGEHRIKVYHQPCRACTAGKMARKANSGRLRRASFYNELIHADLLQFETKDLEGHWYALMLVDDLTREKSVYLLHSKDECGAALQRHCRQEGPMQILRADGGGEFGGKQARPRVYVFDEDTGVLAVCAMYAIKRQETVPHDHDQMGVAEAANRQAVNGVRTMLYAANLPKELWGPAIVHWAYIDRLTVNRAEGASPHMLRYGVAPTKEIRELRTFGARVSFRSEDTQSKLDMPGHQGIFLGRNPENGAYLVLDQEAVDPKIVQTRNVQFDSFDETVVHSEPQGATHEDIRTSNEDIPRMAGLSYPPVRAIPEVVRLPGQVGMGSMWQLFQTYRVDRIEELRRTHPGKSWNDLLKIIGKEWQERLHTQLRKDTAQRLQAIGHAPGDGATCSLRPPAEKSGGVQPRATGAEKSGGSQSPRPAAGKSGGDRESAPASAGTLPDAQGRQDILDTPCEVCKVVDDSDANPMLLCSACGKGYHLWCLDAEVNPSAEDDLWFCWLCRPPGMRLELSLPGRTRGAAQVTSATLLAAKSATTCDIQCVGETSVRYNINLDRHRWRPLSPSKGAYSAYVNSLTATAGTAGLPTDYLVNPPKTLKAALDPSNPFRAHWAGAVRDHFAALFAKGVFTMVHRRDMPPNPEILPCLWVMLIKPDKFKARICIVGSRSRKEVDLDTASPTPRASIWKLMFTIGVKLGYKGHHADLVSAFCHTIPQRQVFIHVPDYMKREGGPEFMLVRRSCFGMPESPKALCVAVRNFFTEYGMVQSTFDPCVYVRAPEKEKQWPFVFVLVHLDDFAWWGPDDWCRTSIEAMRSIFDVEYLGILSRWMGMECSWVDEGLFITQERQTQLIVQRAQHWLPTQVNTAMPCSGDRMSKAWCPQSDAERQFMKERPYRSIVGAIGFCTSIGVRLDCAFAQKELARYAANPGPRHWERLLHLVNFMRKTAHHGLLFPRSGGFQLGGSADADFNGEPDERLSTSGVIVDFGGAAIVAISRTQKYAARSVGQSEHGALAQLAAELLFYRQALESLRLAQGVKGVLVRSDLQAQMHSDSNVAIAAAARPSNWMSDRFKHIHTHMRFWHQYVESGALKLIKVPSQLNPADVLTKIFPSKESFQNAAQHYVKPLPKQFRHGQRDQ